MSQAMQTNPATKQIRKKLITGQLAATARSHTSNPWESKMTSRRTSRQLAIPNMATRPRASAIHPGSREVGRAAAHQAASSAQEAGASKPDQSRRNENRRRSLGSVG